VLRFADGGRPDRPAVEPRRLTVSHWGTYEVVGDPGGAPRLESLREDPDPSLIGFGMLDAYRAPVRIARPAVRAGWLERAPGPGQGAGRGREPFVEVSWETALDLVAGEIRRVRERHGNAAVFAGSYGWASAGRFHHAQSQLRRFWNLLGGHVAHRESYSYAAAQVLLPRIVAPMEVLERTHTDWETLAAHTRLFVSFGGVPYRNAQVSPGGAVVHRVRGGLAALAAAGCRMVNFSPVRTDFEVAGGAVEWLPVRPGSDTAVMLALACETVRANRHDAAFLASHCVGFERWAGYLLGRDDGIVKDAQWAAPIAGVPAARLRALAAEMAGSRTMVNAAWALQRAEHGEQPYWALIGLAAVLGQIGLPGGGFGVGYGCENGPGSRHPVLAAARLPVGDNPVEAFIPVARIADMLLHPGEPFDYDGATHRYPDIRLIHWAGGNPFHHHQDLNRLARAWRRPETIVVHEQVWNAHARRADIVLPASASVERDDVAFAVREPMAVAMAKVQPPYGESRDDHAILAALADRLGVGNAFTDARTTGQWIEWIYERSREQAARIGIGLPAYEVFRKAGLARIETAGCEPPVVMLEAFRTDPSAHPLATPSGRIELWSESIARFGLDDCPGMPVWRAPMEWLGGPLAERYPLHLISDQPSGRLHSQLDHSAVSLAAKVAGREPVWIHPRDAAVRGVVDGDIVRLSNARGACLAGACVTDAVRPGVVKLSTGAWWDPVGTDGLDAHGNPNVLTRDAGTSRLAQGCSAQSCLVQLERFDGLPPPVRAFEPPAFERRGATGIRGT
jgi:biotin/methionine sulfoxide reductase